MVEQALLDYSTHAGFRSVCLRYFKAAGADETDLADVNVRALRYLLAGRESIALNLGTGTGTSVKELIDTIRRATNEPFEIEIAPRRNGDAACLLANNTRAAEILTWRPPRTLDEIVRSA